MATAIPNFEDPDKASELRLRGKRVLVTGGASGIGEACCRMYAAASAFVVIADRKDEDGKALEARLQQGGAAKVCGPTAARDLALTVHDSGFQDHVRFVHVDVTSWQSQISAFREALDFFPGHELDILITSAGIKGSASWEPRPMDPEILRDAAPSAPSMQCLNVGLLGTMYSAHIAATYAMGLHARDALSDATHTKSIVLVGSSAGYRHLPGRPDYTTLKWGIRGLFRSLRHELHPVGVRVNLLAPTFVPTPLIADRLPALRNKGAKLATMDDVLKAIALLSTNERMAGRAVCVTSDGLHDLGDDLDGLDGGTIHAQLVREGHLPPVMKLPGPNYPTLG